MLFFGPNVLFTQFWDPFFWVGDKILLLDSRFFLLRALLFIGPQRDRVRHSHYLHPYISFPYLPPPLVLTTLRTFCPSQRMNSFIWSCVLFHLTVLWMRPKSDFCYAYISLIRHIFTFSSLKIWSYPTLLNVFSFFRSPRSHWRWFLPQSHL